MYHFECRLKSSNVSEKNSKCDGVVQNKIFFHCDTSTNLNVIIYFTIKVFRYMVVINSNKNSKFSTRIK